MPKRLLKVIALTIAITCVLFLSIGIVKKSRAKKMISGRASSLPKVTLFAMDSGFYAFPPLAIGVIFFNSSCEHCQYELRDLSSKMQLFSNKQLVLLSSENISVIKKTAEEMGLNQFTNIHFAKINAKDVFESFGSISVPDILIYGDDHKLIKEFKGETKIEAIARYLP
jgi:thiol-disulfide isomerase/thioredoxin